MYRPELSTEIKEYAKSLLIALFEHQHNVKITLEELKDKEDETA